MNLKCDIIGETVWTVLKIFGVASAVVDFYSWKVFGRGIYSGKRKV